MFFKKAIGGSEERLKTAHAKFKNPRSFFYSVINFVKSIIHKDEEIVRLRTKKDKYRERAIAFLRSYRNSKREQDRLLSIFNLLPDLVCLKNKDRKIILLNHALRRFLGDSYLNQRSYYEHAPAEQKKDIDETDLRVLQGETINYETTEVSHDGKEYRLLKTKMPVHNHKGKVEWILTIARDVTSLHKTQALLNALLSVFPGAVYAVDQSGAILKSKNTPVEIESDANYFSLADACITEKQKNFVKSIITSSEKKTAGESKYVADEFCIIENQGDSEGRWIRTVITYLGVIDGKEIFAISNTDVTNLQKDVLLTNLYSRQALDKQGIDLVRLYLIENTGFSIIMSDLNNFKKINDTYGHAYGDTILKLISIIINKSLRLNKKDYPGRYGGDEFLVILPNTNLDNAQIVAERIRLVVKYYGQGKVPEEVELLFNHSKDEINNIIAEVQHEFNEIVDKDDPILIKILTILAMSLGIAEINAQDRLAGNNVSKKRRDDNFREEFYKEEKLILKVLYERADKNMYTAKTLGGDKVVRD